MILFVSSFWFGVVACQHMPTIDAHSQIYNSPLLKAHMAQPSHKYSHIPLDHLKTYLTDCANIGEYIVSVGSGDGTYENWLTQDSEKLRKKLILVDPNPGHFRGLGGGFLGLHPNYARVADLVQDNEAVVDNCTLLLIWPVPNLYDGYGYDIEAIYQLRPRSVICMYEKPENMDSGASGSDALFEFMKCDPAYSHICTTRYAFNKDYPKLTWMAKRGTQVPKVKKCLGLQDVADGMCAEGLKGEKDYTCTPEDVLKTAINLIATGEMSIAEMGEIFRRAREEARK